MHHHHIQHAQAPAPAWSGRAGQARHDEMALIAGYESGVREPGAWHHIGEHMHADAKPIICRRRRIPRRSIATRIVDAIKCWLQR